MKRRCRSSIVPYLVNTAWMLSCCGSLRRLQRSFSDVASAQQQLLQRVVDANRQCTFGREYQFGKIHDVDDFRSRVPVCDYEFFEPWIDQIGLGRSRVLTTEPVRILEPTSGNVDGRRLIPYTNSLRKQFHNGIQPWIADLFANRPRLRRGRAYWMVTPALVRSETDGGVKIGFADDTEYLGLAQRYAARYVTAVSSSDMNGVPLDDAAYQTMLRLATTQDLALLSIWSPTFLNVLARVLEESRERFVSDLKAIGQPSHSRAVSVVESQASIPEKLARLWPNLQLVSCWADGSSSHFISEVRDLLPGIEIQPKGLISTEAFTSLPIINQSGNALAIRSHFFEFQPTDRGSDTTRLAHELSVGQQYRVIVTTGGGLYRYQTHDVIEVVGFANQCPLLQFSGRDNKTSDLVGEKLSERFVGSAITHMTERLKITPRFAMLIPRRKPLGYRLLIEWEASSRASVSEGVISETLDRYLCENPYYDHAVRIGQLQRLETIIGRERGRLWEVYQQQCLAIGMRLGNIKPTALETRFQWDEMSSLS